MTHCQEESLHSIEAIMAHVRLIGSPTMWTENDTGYDFDYVATCSGNDSSDICLVQRLTD
jgi:hypothetical protein